MADPTPPAAPDELLVALKAMLGPVLSAAMGMVWRRARELREGKRLSWRALMLDIPCVVGTGMIAGSVALYLGLPLAVSFGLACALSYIGTEALLEKLVPLILDSFSRKPRRP